MIPLNDDIADRLDEVGALLDEQHANPFRVRAYHRAADTLRRLDRSIATILDEGGVPALVALPAIGDHIARAIQLMVRDGSLPQLDRLRGESDPVTLLRTVPGIGPKLADRLHEELGVDTLEELEAAAHDGRLEAMGGFGTKRLSAVRETLAHRLQRVRAARPAPTEADPPVAEILDVDREYREAVAGGTLPLIAPRRFNPTSEAWLPVLHAHRGDRHYTALFSNTRRAHDLGTTRDWVVVYCDGHRGERQWTVVTARWGARAGKEDRAGPRARVRRAEREELS